MSSETVTIPGDVATAGTFVRPDGAGSAPAVLLIAGSGPTDRDGNTPLLPGRIDTLAFLAERLAEGGVASLRYDKLGVGATPLAGDPSAITFTDFVDQAVAAYDWLAARPEVDVERVTVAGHSEGALIALQLSERRDVDRLALIAPPPARYLDVIGAQLQGRLTDEQRAAFETAVEQLRRTGALLAAPTRPPLNQIFASRNLRFLATADEADPVALAGALPPATSTLLMCGEVDVQVPCDTLDELRDALGSTRLTFEELVGTNHVLRRSGGSGGPGTYTDESLPHNDEAADLLVDLATARA